MNDPVERLHGIVNALARAFRGYLPHENTSGEFSSMNQNLSSGTRTQLALIEEATSAADKIVGGDRPYAFGTVHCPGCGTWCRWTGDHGDRQLEDFKRGAAPMRAQCVRCSRTWDCSVELPEGGLMLRQMKEVRP